MSVGRENKKLDFSEKELDFKYHTQEFLDVSQELRHVGNIGMHAKRSPGMVHRFFDSVEYLVEIYYSYFLHPKDILSYLNDAEKALENPKYLKELSDFLKNGDPEIGENVLRHENKIIKIIKKAFRQISEDLVESELRPRPTQKIKDDHPEIDDSATKEVLRGLNSVLKK